ncbi:MAG: hypothetical protein ACPHXR_06945, partial [Flavicella sp.]
MKTTIRNFFAKFVLRNATPCFSFAGLKLLVVVLFVASIGQSLQAQNYSNTHYLPPLHNTQDGNDIANKVVVHLTTMETSPFTVTIYSHTSSNTWVAYTTRTISKTSPASVSIYCSSSGDCGYLTAIGIGSDDEDSGFKVSGPNPFYVNVDVLAGSQTASYSSKGLSALGTEFYSAQFESNSIDLGKFGDFISVMAVEPGSTTITYTKNNSNWQPSWYNSKTLNEGDIHILRNDTQSDSNIGTKITSDKNIVVVSGTWAGGIGDSNNGGGRDMGAIQLVPTDKLGTDFLVHEGYSSSFTGTHAIVVASQNSTNIYVNGSYMTSINAGSHYAYNLKGNGNNLKHINTSKPAMVYYQGYVSSNSSAKNNHGLFLVAPLLSESGAPSGSSHAHYGDKAWDLYENNTGKMAYYVMTSDPSNTTVTLNGSTVGLTSWGATSMTRTVNGVTYYMYEKNEQNAPNSDNDFYISNSNGKPIYTYMGYSSNDRGYFVSNQAFASSNSCPVAGSPFPAIAPSENANNVNINLNTYFSDPDGDNLTYTLTGNTNSAVIVAAIVSGSTLVLDPVGVGTTAITIQASDGTCTFDRTINISVTPAPNSCPVDGTFPLENRTADISDGNTTINLDTAFSDSNGDDLTYTITQHTNNTVVIAAIVSGSFLVMDPNQVGTTTMSITASDGTCSKTQQFTFTVTQSNTCPVDGNFPLENISASATDSDMTINLDMAFTDVDEDDMTYTLISNSDASVASTSFTGAGNYLVIDYLTAGTTTLTIQASDGTCTHNQSFTITLTAPDIDSDGDGITDSTDLDDDNDGILDTDEGCNDQVNLGDNKFLNGSLTGNITQEGLPLNWSSYSSSVPDTNDENNALGNYNYANYINQPSPSSDTGTWVGLINSTTNIEGIHQTVYLEGGKTYQIAFEQANYGIVFGYPNEFTRNNPVSVDVTVGASGSDVLIGNGGEMPLNTEWNTQSLTYTPTTSGNYRINFVAKNLDAHVNIDGLSIREVLQGSSGTCQGQDTDNDGTPDHLDTDSDGDGCADAVEAGFTDADDDGQVDGTGINADGKVSGGDGYTTPADTDSSGTADHLESGVAGCLTDTDGDGIPDSTDLDDDNDGIVDTDEGCTITYSYTNATANSNGEYTIHAFTDGLLANDGYIDGTTVFIANGLQSETLTIKDNDDTLHDSYSGNGQYTDSDGEQYIVGTSNVIRSVSHAVITNNTTGETGKVYQLQIVGETNFYHAPTIEINNGDNITWTASNNTSVQFPKFAIGQALYSTLLSPVANEDVCTGIDTDNDGTPDHLDTDSDGDGCSDAEEAGFTDADEDGQVDGTGIDADGKVSGGDGYSTPADTDSSGTADHLESGVAACALDTDGDGIPDDTDVDDDNDGILDVVECGTSGTNAIVDGSFESYTPTSHSQGGLLPDWFNWNTGSPDLNKQGGYEATWFSFQTPLVGDNYVGMIANGTNKEGLSQNLSSVIASGTYINWSVWAASGKLINSIYNNEETVTLEIYGNPYSNRTGSTESAIPSGAVLLDEIDITSTDMSSYTSAFTAPFDIANISMSLRWTTGDVQRAIMVDEFIMSSLDENDSNVVCDADSDGIPDQLDTDSDGDGCPDAIEAGFTDTDFNGQVDGTGVDANGRVTGSDG